MSQNPLERAIEQLESEYHWADKDEISDIWRKAKNICQRILDESRENTSLGNPEWCGGEVQCSQRKPCEPAPKRWEVEIGFRLGGFMKQFNQLLEDGWEPFAISGRDQVWFKRLVPCEKKV